jgi:thioredoxin 1
MGSVQIITDAEFEKEVLQVESPVLVYFWAPWCGPCKLVSPSIDAIASQYADRVKVVKMEIDPNPATVAKYQVEGVPAVRLLKKQEVILSHEGAITKPKLIALLEAKL